MNIRIQTWGEFLRFNDDPVENVLNLGQMIQVSRRMTLFAKALRI